MDKLKNLFFLWCNYIQAKFAAILPISYFKKHVVFLKHFYSLIEFNLWMLICVYREVW